MLVSLIFDLLALCTVYHGFFCCVHLYGFYRGKRLWQKQRNLAIDWPTVSIIVPARNEAETLPLVLSDLSGLDYPAQFEVIVVDDASEDDTHAIAKRFAQKDSRFRVIRVDGGKKHALTAGIAIANMRFIVTTDADCRFQRQWLRELIEVDSEVVMAGVRFRTDGTWFTDLQAAESAGLIAMTAGGLGICYPTLANGANFGFTKAAFEAVGGYTGISHVASGDDMMLLTKLHNAGYAIRYSYGSDAMVETLPCKTLRAFFWQRLRWVSKSKAYQNRSLKVALIMSWLGHVAIILQLCLGEWEVAGGLFLLKFLPETLLTHAGLTLLGQPKSVYRAIIPAQVLHLIYVVILPIISLAVKTYRWKGRTVH